MASGKSFKDSYGASAEFKGGIVDPATIMIVGLDVPVEDWNQDLHDESRLAIAKDSVEANTPEAQAFIASIVEYGVTDEIKVAKRRGVILAVDGRRRILGARKANTLLAAAKSKVKVQVPIVVDKTDDQVVAMRLGNAFRLEDPPWVKAREAARLRRMNYTDKQIGLLSGGVEPVTLKNWGHYMDLDPTIQRMVEHPAPGQDRLPFAVAFEIGKLGKGKDHQILALDCLHNMGAQLTGEIGRANVKAVVERIKSGDLTKAPPMVFPNPAPNVSPATAPSRGPDVAPPGSMTSGPGNPFSDHGAHTEPHKPREPRAPSVVTNQRIKPAHVLAIVGYLEPTEHSPHEDEYEELAWRIAQVYAGNDPECAGLEKWEGVQVSFQRALGVTKQAKEVKAQKAAKAAEKAAKKGSKK